MNIVKYIKSLLKKGFATPEEKAELKSMLKELESDEVEAIQEDVDKVDELPEEEESDDDDVLDEVEKSLATLVDTKGKKIEKSVLSKVQELIDEHKENLKKGAGVYNEEIQKDAQRKLANEYLREKIASLVEGKETKRFQELKKEMTTDSTGSPYAGYAIDDFLSAEIRHLQTQYGVAAREFETVSFTQSAYKANNLATDVSVFWVDEAGSISSTQAVLGQGSLELKKLAAIVTLTRELMQEQEIDFISFLGSRVAEGFAQKEDEAFFIGDGTSTYGSFTGLLENASVNEVTMSGSTFASLSVSDLRDMQDETPQGALPNAKYYMNRKVLSIIRNLREDAVSAGDGAGAFLYKAPSGNDPANIDGYPIVLVEAMPSTTAADTSFILFGDLRKATIRGVRGGIVADRFNAGTVRNVAGNADLNLITTDREAVRWVQQVGYIAIIPTAVTKLTTASASA